MTQICTKPGTWRYLDDYGKRMMKTEEGNEDRKGGKE